MHTWGVIKLCDDVHVTSVSFFDIGPYSMQYKWSRQLLDRRKLTARQWLTVGDNITLRRTTCDVIAGYWPVCDVGWGHCHRWESGH
jgi:hypothetical protein